MGCQLCEGAVVPRAPCGCARIALAEFVSRLFLNGNKSRLGVKVTPMICHDPYVVAMSSPRPSTRARLII